MKTIWHISANRWNSAITEYALSSARALKGQGYETFFTPLAESPAESRAHSYELKCMSFEGFGLTAVPKFLSVAKEIKPDLIVVYGGAEASLCSAAMLFMKNVPVVRFRGEDVTIKDWGLVSEIRHKLGNRGISRIITPSESVAGRLSDIISSPPITPVTLGCDTNKYYFKGDMRRPEERPEIMILGRLDPVKGHAKFIYCFSLMLKMWPEHLPRPILHIAGEPANVSKSDLESCALSHGLKIGEDVRLSTERFEDLTDVISRVTLGVVSSLGSEAICRVAEEFLLCGVAVYVSGVGSLKDVLFEDAGLAYGALNEEQIAEVLLNLMQKCMNEKAQERSQRALRSQELFSLETMGQELEKALLL